MFDTTQASDKAFELGKEHGKAAGSGDLELLEAAGVPERES